MKVKIVEEVIAYDVSPVAMFLSDTRNGLSVAINILQPRSQPDEVPSRREDAHHTQQGEEVNSREPYTADTLR